MYFDVIRIMIVVNVNSRHFSRLATHIESSVGDLLQSLMHNTATTGNFASLIRLVSLFRLQYT